MLWDPAVVPWQPMASHRLVPVVLPGLVLFAVWMSSRLTARAAALGASRAVVALTAACCVLALAIPPLVTTLNPGLTAQPSVGRYSSSLSKLVSRVQLRGVGATATYGGSLSAASALCAAIGPSASVLFTDSSTATTFAPAVRGLCGQPAALVAHAGRRPRRPPRTCAGRVLDRAGRAAPGAARPDTVVGVAVRGPCPTGGLAPDFRGRRGPERRAGRHLAGHVLAVAGGPARYVVRAFPCPFRGCSRRRFASVAESS